MQEKREIFMTCTEAYKEHIMNIFSDFCKVLYASAINVKRGNCYMEAGRTDHIYLHWLG